jgi:hypothetical protein
MFAQRSPFFIELLSQAVRSDPGSGISNVLKLSSTLSDEGIEYFRFDNCPKQSSENHEDRKEGQIKKNLLRGDQLRSFGMILTDRSGDESIRSFGKSLTGSP